MKARYPEYVIMYLHVYCLTLKFAYSAKIRQIDDCRKIIVQIRFGIGEDAFFARQGLSRLKTQLYNAPMCVNVCCLSHVPPEHDKGVSQIVSSSLMCTPTLSQLDRYFNQVLVLLYSLFVFIVSKVRNYNDKIN